MIDTHASEGEKETSQGVDEDAEDRRGVVGGARGVTVAQNKPKRSYTNTKMRRSFINCEIRANDSENVCESNSKSKRLRFLRNCCFMLSN